MPNEMSRKEKLVFLWKAGKTVEDLVEIFESTYAEIRKELRAECPDDQSLKLPEAQLTGEDGNVFNLIGICSRVLKKAGQAKEAGEMTARIFKSGSYDEALGIMSEYCETM